MCARSGLILRRNDAVTLAAEAAAIFDDQSRPRWRDRAHLVRLECLLVDGTATEADERFARSLAKRFEGDGLRGPASRAALVAGMIALDHGSTTRAKNRIATGSAARGSSLIEDRLAYWSLVASYRLASGQRSEAMAAARAGLVDLARSRNHLAAPDARVGVAAHAEALVSVGLRAASQARSPRTLLEWFERTASIYEPSTSGGTSEADELGGLLMELRSVTQDLSDSAR